MSAWNRIDDLHKQGLSYAKIAKKLNDEGVTTKLGKKFNSVNAFNVHKKFKNTPLKSSAPPAAPKTTDKAYAQFLISNIETSLEALKKLL